MRLESLLPGFLTLFRFCKVSGFAGTSRFQTPLRREKVGGGTSVSLDELQSAQKELRALLRKDIGFHGLTNNSSSEVGSTWG